MKSYNSNKTIFSRGIVLCVSIAVFCGILCSYLYWGPSIANFFLVTLPSAKRSLFSPECLILLLNAIVAILVGESRLGRPNPSVPRSKDIYEEYVARSGSLQRVSSFSNYENSTDSKIVKHEDDHKDDKGDHKNSGGNNDEDDNGGLGADELNKRVEEFIAKVD